VVATVASVRVKGRAQIWHSTLLVKMFLVLGSGDLMWPRYGPHNETCTCSLRCQDYCGVCVFGGSRARLFAAC
jgi:hypothetical protein